MPKRIRVGRRKTKGKPAGGMKRAVKRIVNATIKSKLGGPDFRYSDDDSGDVFLSSAGTVDVGIFSVPPRGDVLQGQRTGDTIQIHSMRMVVTVTGVQSTLGLADIFNRFGFRVFFIKSNNGSSSPPSATGANGVYDTSAFSGSGLVYAPWGPGLKPQVRAIAGRHGMVAGVDYTVATSNIQFVKENIATFVIYKKFKRPVVVKFTASDSNTQSTWITNMPVFCAISDSTTGSHPTLRYQTRWWYTA